ncbi:MAG: carbohydrate ABC transporter permease [Parasporobacterium sp.]|nr:carbohydrate ABC transporter permease [Parasporobacterium sp.]MBR3401968.1 carbohydrate ABC transporter permease [Parasporobacterium sp.]
MKKKRRNLIRYLLISVISLLFAFPVIWVFITSFKKPIDATSFFRFTIPPKFDNYLDAWLNSGFSKAFLNTMVISVVTVAISLFAGFLFAYAIMRSPISSKVRKFFFNGVYSMRIIPEMVFLIPLFILYQETKMYDTILGLIFAFQVLTLPYCIMLLCNFIRDIPPDLEWAARLDGCSEGQVMSRVVLPLCMPGIVTSGILAFIAVWTALMFPLALAYSKATTVAVTISIFKGYGSFNWPVMAAASMIITVPQILLFAFCNKYLISGYTMGAVKE